MVDTESHYRHLVYAGCAVDGSGCWLFRDGIFTYDDLAGTLPDCEQGKQSENRHVAISAFIEGKWSQTNLSKLIPRANVILHSYIKARDKLVSSAVSQFVNKISSLLTEVISRQTSAPKEAVIADEKQKFSRPKLLIFPANTSVSAIVGLPGFTFGYADCGYLKPRYSESMLHNLDAVDLLVVPNVSFNKALNLTSFQNGLSPMHILLNDFRVMNTEKPAHKCVGSERGLSVQFRHLLDGLKCALRKSNISSETCILPSPTNNLPSVIKLYQKVGMGSADLLLIHPVNFKEVKQSSDANKCDCLSSVFVWKPFDDDAKVLRIFFPGTAPICKVYEGLERLRGNAMFEAPSVQHKNLATKMSMKQEFSPKQVQQQAAKFAVTKSAVKSATAIAGKSVGSASAKPASKATVVSKTKDNLKHSATVKTNSSKHVSDAGKVAVVSNRRQQTEKLSITTSEPLSSSLSIPNQSITPSEMETPGQTDNSADYPVPAVVLVSQEKDANCPEIHTYDDTDGWATTDSLTVQTTIVTEGCENEGKPLSNELGKLPHSNVASYTAEGQVIESAKFATELPRNVETPDVRCDSKVQSDGVQELDSKSNFNYMVETIREEDDSAGSGWTALCDASTSEVNDQQSTKSTVFNADDVTQFAADDDLAQDSETENFAAEIDESVSCKDSEHDVILLNRQGSISEGGEVNDCTVDKRLLVEVSDNPDLTETSDSIEPGVDDANVGADNTDRNSETVNKFNVGSVFSDNARSFENVSDANAFYQNSGMASSQESLKSEERVIAAYDDMVELVCSGDDVKKSLAISDDDDAVETPDTELTEDMTTNGDENIVLEAAADCLEESIASSAATDHLAESLAVTTSADGVEEKMASATVTDCLVYDILGVSEPAENIVTDSAADDFEEKLESATVAHCLAENIVGVPVIAENILAAMPSGSLEEDIARATGSDSLAESLVLIPVPRENAVINTAADNLMQNIRMVAGTDEDVKAPVDSLEENIAVVVATDYCAYDVSPVPAENMITSTSADRLDDEIGSTATNDCPAQNIIGVPVIAENFETNTAADSLKENSASAIETDNCSQIDVNKEACSPCIDLAERENAESLSEHEHSDLLSDFNKMNCEIIPQVITVCEDNECEKTDSGAEDANGVIACEISVDEAENGTDVTKCVSFVDDAGVDSHVVASSSATNIDENVNIDGTMVIHVNSNEEGINNETSNRVSNVITDTANLGQNALKPSEGVDDYGAAESTEVTVEDASDATVFKSNADIDSDRMEINSEMPAPTDTDFNTHNAFEDTAVPEVGHVNTGCSETFDGHNGSSSSNVINDHMKSADVFVEGRVADVTVFDDDVIKNNNFDPFGGGVIDEACSGKRDEMNQNCNEEMSRQTGVPDINDPRNQTVTDAQTSVDEAYFQVCSPNEIIDHIDTAADRSDVADSSVDEDYKLGNGTNKLAASENDTGFKNETLITASTSGTNPEPVEDTGVTTNSEDTYVSMEIVQLAITCTDSANIQSDVAEPSAEQDALTNRVTLEITGAGAAYAHAGDDDVQKSIANEEHHETGHLEIADENGETFSTVSDPARTTDTLTPCTDAEVANIPKSDNTIATTGTVDGSTDIRKNEDTTAQGTMECITDPTTQPNDETVSVTASETVMDSDSGDRHHDDTDNQKIKPVSSDVSCASHTILNGSRLHGNTPCDVQYVDSEDTRYSQSSHSSSVTSESNDTNICTYTTNATDHPSSSCHEDEPVCCEIAARFEHTGDHDVSERNTENAEETSSTGTTDNPFVEEKDSIILQAGVPDYSSLKERGGGLNAQSTSCDYLDLVSSDTQPNLVTLDSEEDAVPCDSQETLMTYSSDRPDHDVDRATGGIYASADAQKQDSEDELSKVTVDKFSSLHIEADERLMTEENINEATGTWQQLHGLQTCDEQLVQENPAIMEEPKLSCELSACCSEESSALNSDSHLTKSALESRSDKEVKCETESTSEKSDHSTYTGIHENNIRSIENFGVKGDLPLGDTQLLEGGKHDDVAQQSHTNTMEDNSGTLHIAQRTKEIACAELDDHLGDAHYCCKTGDTAQFVPPADASICSTVAENSIKSVGLDVAEIGKAEIGEPDANNKSITFDPIAEWGEPMALPAPATVSANKNKQGKGKDNDEQPKSTQSAATPPKSATVKSSLGPLKSNKLATKPTLTSPRHSVGERLTASRDIVRKGEKSAAESVSASKKASPSVRLAGIESDQIQVSLICIMDDTQIYRQSYVSYPFGPVY